MERTHFAELLKSEDLLYAFYRRVTDMSVLFGLHLLYVSQW